MNLEQLKSIATFSENWVKKSVEYTPAGAKEPVVFDVHVKAQPSVEDFEAIQGLSRHAESDSFLVEQVVRLVRFGRDGKESISAADAKQLDYKLLLSLGAAIREVGEANDPKTDS